MSPQNCVSGNSLSAGDYQVGIAFLHPRQPGAFFHLVNLPTTQRRLAYEFLVEDQSDAQRLTQISEHTLGRILEKLPRPLDDDEMSLLDLLDPDSVSRFVGPYFQAVPDGSCATITRARLVRRVGTWLMCLWLAIHGTHEAIPGLGQAIDGRRINEPDEVRPFRIGLDCGGSQVIAGRDPWDGEDAWLAQRVQRTDRLDLGSRKRRGSHCRRAVTAPA